MIKDFQRWQTWHPAFVTTEITKGGGNAKGTVRVLAASEPGAEVEAQESEEGKVIEAEADDAETAKESD